MEDGDGRRDVGADEARLPKDEGVSAVLSHIGGSIGLSPLVFLLGFVGTYVMHSMLSLEAFDPASIQWASILVGEYPGRAEVLLRLCRDGGLMMRLLFFVSTAGEAASPAFSTSPDNTDE